MVIYLLAKHAWHNRLHVLNQKIMMLMMVIMMMSRTPVLKALERSCDKKKAISHRCEIGMTQEYCGTSRKRTLRDRHDSSGSTD